MIAEALARLRASYVFPDRAEAAAATVQRRLAAGEYERLAGDALAARLTADLFEVCADRHLRVRRADPDLPAPSEQERAAAWRERLRLANYGIARVERLAGNVGYLDLRLIAEPGDGGRAIAAAMALVSHTHALIVDVRRNGGGSPAGVAFWHSYLFPDDDTHLNDVYERAGGTVRQFWTLAYVPGERYLDRPVYVLTGADTFSGGEEFCYNLKATGRATLVGGTTRGGAHPTTVFPLDGGWEITVPTARSVNPITGTNWEGTGVEPDVAVEPDRAFDVAYERALEHVRTVITSADVRKEAAAALDRLRRRG
jgi:C-terminal processing protease CtpA/Prc